MAQNTRIANLSLLFFAAFIVVISIMNCIEYYRIINAEDTGVSNLTQAKWWFAFNIVLAMLGCVYFIYRSYLMLNSFSLSNEAIRDLKQYLTSENKIEIKPKVKKEGKGFFGKLFNSTKKVETDYSSAAFDEFKRASIVKGID